MFDDDKIYDPDYEDAVEAPQQVNFDDELDELTEEYRQVSTADKIKGMILPIIISAAFIYYGYTKLKELYVSPAEPVVQEQQGLGFTPTTKEVTRPADDAKSSTNQVAQSEGPNETVAEPVRMDEKTPPQVTELTQPPTTSTSAASHGSRSSEFDDIRQTALQESITQIQERTVEESAQIDKLVEQTEEMRSGITVLKKDMEQLNEALSKQLVLQEKIEHAVAIILQVHKNAAALKRKQAIERAAAAAKRKKAQATTRKGKVATEDYFVQAVIPGRAWVTTKSGITRTVGVGDQLPGYGKVISIDARDGTLMTGSGRAIIFGIEAN